MAARVLAKRQSNSATRGATLTNLQRILQGFSFGLKSHTLNDNDYLSVSGRLDCAGFLNCNTSAKTWEADKDGNPLTQFSYVLEPGEGPGYNGGSGFGSTGIKYGGNGNADSAITLANCPKANNQTPTWIYNTTTGEPIGVYIDDDDGTVTVIQNLVDCVAEQEYAHGLFAGEPALYPGWRAGQKWVILVSWSSGGGSISVPASVYGGSSALEVGNMMEWYPFCDFMKNGVRHNTSTESVAPRSIAGAHMEGYVTQYKFDGNYNEPNWTTTDDASAGGCYLSPTESQVNAEWDPAWALVNGDKTSGKVNTDGGYYDLVATF